MPAFVVGKPFCRKVFLFLYKKYVATVSSDDNIHKRHHHVGVFYVYMWVCYCFILLLKLLFMIFMMVIITLQYCGFIVLAFTCCATTGGFSLQRSAA